MCTYKNVQQNEEEVFQDGDFELKVCHTDVLRNYRILGCRYEMPTAVYYIVTISIHEIELHDDLHPNSILICCRPSKSQAGCDYFLNPLVKYKY